MADFGIRYSSVITPTETVTLEDGTTTKTFIHSDIDARFGGKTSKDVGTGSTKVATKTYSINSANRTLDTIIGTNLANVSLLYVEILSADGAGTPDCFVRRSTEILSKGVEVGDWFLIRPNQVSGSSIYIYSSSDLAACTIRIVYALF
jgi:hypothetical protein